MELQQRGSSPGKDADVQGIDAGAEGHNTQLRCYGRSV
jgi:hypothetical protein